MTTTFYDSLGTDSGSFLFVMGAVSNGGDGPLGQSFTTAAGSSWSNLHIQLALSVFNGVGSPTGGITISLCSNTPGSPPTPGAVLHTLGTFTDDDINQLPSFMEFVGVSQVLAPSTRYWITLTETPDDAGNPTQVLIDFSDPADPGALGEYSLEDTEVNLNYNPLTMSVLGDPVAPGSDATKFFFGG